MQDFNGFTEEFGRTEGEHRTEREQQDFVDIQVFSDMRAFEEVKAPEKTSGRRASSGHGFFSKNRLSSFLVGSLATLLLGTTLPPVKQAISPLGDMQAELLAIEVADTALNYHLRLSGEGEAELLLHNDFTDRRISLGDGENIGSFSDLQPGMRYSLSVIGEGLLGEETIATWQIKTEAEPPVPPYEAEIIEASVDMNGIYFTASTQGDGRFLAVLSGGELRLTEELPTGTAEASFENLPMGVSYTLSIVAEDLWGETVLASRKIIIPHPLEFTEASFVELGADGPAIYYMASISSIQELESLGLEVVLYHNGNAIRSAPFERIDDSFLDNPAEYDPTVGNMVGDFTDLIPGESYTIAVIGQGNGEYVLTQEELLIPIE